MEKYSPVFQSLNFKCKPIVDCTFWHWSFSFWKQKNHFLEWRMLSKMSGNTENSELKVFVSSPLARLIALLQIALFPPMSFFSHVPIKCPCPHVYWPPLHPRSILSLWRRKQNCNYSQSYKFLCDNSLFHSLLWERKIHVCVCVCSCVCIVCKYWVCKQSLELT